MIITGSSTIAPLVAEIAKRFEAQMVIGDNQQGIKSVAANPGAIGYVSIGTAEYEENHATPIKLISLHGVAATVGNVKDGTFPLSRPLNLVTKGAPNYAAFFWMTERVGKLIELGQCVKLFDAPQSALTRAYVTGAAG